MEIWLLTKYKHYIVTQLISLYEKYSNYYFIVIRIYSTELYSLTEQSSDILESIGIGKTNEDFSLWIKTFFFQKKDTGELIVRYIVLLSIKCEGKLQSE